MDHGWPTILYFRAHKRDLHVIACAVSRALRSAMRRKCFPGQRLEILPDPAHTVMLLVVDASRIMQAGVYLRPRTMETKTPTMLCGPTAEALNGIRFSPGLCGGCALNTKGKGQKVGQHGRLHCIRKVRVNVRVKIQASSVGIMHSWYLVV